MVKIEIILKKDNPLFKREEIEFKITGSEATPSKTQTRELLLASVKAKDELMVIKKITTFFGNNEVKGTAYVYKDRKTLERIEPKHIVKRNTIKAEKKVEEAAAPAEEFVDKAPAETSESKGDAE